MTGRHAPTPRRTVEYEEAEARAERREERERRRREYQSSLPLHARESARATDPADQLDLGNGWSYTPGDHPRATIWARRYRGGIEIGGHATPEQLIELRDALSAHIRKKLEEASDE